MAQNPVPTPAPKQPNQPVTVKPAGQPMQPARPAQPQANPNQGGQRPPANNSGLKPPTPPRPPQQQVRPQPGDVMPPPSRIQQAIPKPAAQTAGMLTGKPQQAARPNVPAGMTPKPGTTGAGLAAVGGAAVGSAAAGAGKLPPAGPANSGATPTPPPKNPQMAMVKQSPLRFLPFVVGALLVVGLIWFLFTRFFGNRPTTTTRTPATTGNSQVTLTYWGLWEPTAVMDEVIADFEKENPTVKVNYQQQSYKDYRERLQTAIVSGRGPDVFRFHASWVPMLRQELTPVPAFVFTKETFDQTFYPIAGRQLTLDEQLVGVPLMYDGLALYYNEEILRAANAQPPSTWDEVRSLAKQLTVRSGSNIQRGGIAMGNATNVEHFSDIIGLLMLQNGGDPRQPTSTQVKETMKYYTDFVKVDKVWDETLPSSTVAFARGDVAMMIAPSWRVHEIQALNPNLKFAIAPIPQLTSTRTTWGSYWAEGVSAQSKHRAEAWSLVKYMSSPEVMKKFYSEAMKVRAFGEMYSRKDLAPELADKPYVGAYISDAPYARGWNLASFTHDNGINDLIIKYYEDAVTAILEGRDAEQVMGTVEQGTRTTLRQYGINIGGPAPAQ